jgi:hypothetical protein
VRPVDQLDLEGGKPALGDRVVQAGAGAAHRAAQPQPLARLMRAGCWVGPGRGAGPSTGPFPRPARGTGRGTFTASGSPRVHAADQPALPGGRPRCRDAVSPVAVEADRDRARFEQRAPVVCGGPPAGQAAFTRRCATCPLLAKCTTAKAGRRCRSNPGRPTVSRPPTKPPTRIPGQLPALAAGGGRSVA